MRILLSASNFCCDPYAVYPLGMSVVARALARQGHLVRQFDPMLYGKEHYPEKMREAMDSFRPQAVGVSIRNLDNIDSGKTVNELLEQSLEVIGRWRSLASSIPLVLGGPGFSIYPERMLALTRAEYGIAGEGEASIVALFGALERGEKVPYGILRASSPEQSGALYDQEIVSFYCNETHMLPVQTKRGCPFRCAYCTYPMLEGRTMRLRDTDEVLRDLVYIRDHAPGCMVYFVDSVFNDPGRHYIELVDAMIEQKINVPWTGFITPANLREGDLERMAASGMAAVDLGVDAACDATLRGLDKSFSFDDVRRCCDGLHRLKIGITTSVMFGGPGETYQTIAEGIANLRSLEPAYSIVVSGIRVLEGAPLLELARKENKVPPDWDGIGSLFYFAPGLDQKRVHEMLLEGFRDSRYCVYPPDSRNRDVRMIHKFGYTKLRGLQLSGK